jgi:hypothetical protein
MYWTSEADLSGFIFGNVADWLFCEQVLLSISDSCTRDKIAKMV